MAERSENYRETAARLGMAQNADALLLCYIYSQWCIQRERHWPHLAASVAREFGGHAVNTLPMVVQRFRELDLRQLRFKNVTTFVNASPFDLKAEVKETFRGTIQFLNSCHAYHPKEVLCFLEFIPNADICRYAPFVFNGLKSAGPHTNTSAFWESWRDAVLCDLQLLQNDHQFIDGPSLEEEQPTIQQRSRKSVESTFDELISRTKAYRCFDAFSEMVTFCGRFRDYAPYNNMLVKVQNPACGFYATERDWRVRFGRKVKEDARPMLILAPMHPVMLVYDLDSTDGERLPEKLESFAKVDGIVKPKWLKCLTENLERDRVRVERKHLSSTNAGFATTRVRSGEFKMRIAIHDGLDDAAAFTILCHEAAHIYLGHLGPDENGWWPDRKNLALSAEEIEAEAVSYIVACRLGLKTRSDAYLSSYLPANGDVPLSVSIEWISKVAGMIIERAESRLPKRRTKEKAG